MHARTIVSLVIIGAIVFLLSASLFVVQQTERAVVLRFGED